MQISKRISPCLWFDGRAEEAANFYVSIFKNSKVTQISRYPKAGKETHQREPGSVLTVAFELDGQPMTALNGPPIFKFNEALSLQIYVEDQKEYDYYWDKLTPGGDPKAQVCGWLKDKYGLSWQVVPRKMLDWWTHMDEKSERAFAAMMKMGKLDIPALERAYEGRQAA
jgi:predicted 3-demethylubiquinone-9 3-methyltransferase (glyoxalase superfamily)